MITLAIKRSRLAGIVCAFALIMAASPAWSAGVVSNLDDSGAGSLRSAVVGGGAVTFTVTGTITLTSGQIPLSADTTISGPGADQLGISAGNASRIFDIAAATSVSISGATLTAGNAGSGERGGAIRNAGSLALDAVAISNNVAGDAGGGIYSSGILSVLDSVLNGNSVGDAGCAGGGAIRSEGNAAILTVTDSTVTGNGAASCSGGGISFSGAMATISGGTIAANTAASSGGNLYKGSSAATLTLTGTVVSDGVAGGGTPVNTDLHGALVGGFVSNGYNLVESRGDSTGYVGTDLADGTLPLFTALAANGGPTATLAFAPDSPLRDAAGACALPTDQRGVARPQGSACDIGAFEYRVSRLGITVTGTGIVSAADPPTPITGGITNCADSCTADYDGEVAPTVSLTATPGANQLFAGWSGDCSGSAATTTVVMDAPRNCTATFNMPVATVTSSVSGGNGTINPAGAQVVTIGTTVQFTLAPALNYHVDSVGGSCGGALSGPDNTIYTTAPIATDCSVIAQFAIDQFTVTPSVTDGHGTIDPSTPQTVDHGTTTSFTLTPETNYHIVTPVGGTCGGTLSGNIYTTDPVAANCSVIASFTIDQYTVTPSVSGGNGTIDPSTPQSVDHNATVNFTLAPADHYHIDSVAGSCGGTLAGDVYTTDAIDADCDVVASFAIDTHTVGGSVSGLVGSDLVLRLNGDDPLLVTQNGTFVFANPLDDLSDYAVTIAQQPVSPAQVCSVTDGSGSLDGSDVTNVAVICATPVPHLTVSVTDNHDYARYGMLINYLVTVTNDGTGDASGVRVSNLSPPQLDAGFTTWTCPNTGDGAICGSGSGALDDTGVSIPIGRSLTWLVSAPLLVDAPAITVDYTVDVSGPVSTSATDSDILVILRTGFDVPYGDGAESAIDSPEHACMRSGARDRFDLTSTYGVTLDATPNAMPARPVIDSVFVARDSHAIGFRIERLNLGAIPQIRIVTTDTKGTERASDWASTPDGTVLVIATASSGGQSVLLVEGADTSLSLPLPRGMDGTVNVWEPVTTCH